jgi:hypothetical protein
VEHRFRDACRNAAFKIPGETVTAGMINEVHVAASSYVGKQVWWAAKRTCRSSQIVLLTDSGIQSWACVRACVRARMCVMLSCLCLFADTTLSLEAKPAAVCARR